MIFGGWSTSPLFKESGLLDSSIGPSRVGGADFSYRRSLLLSKTNISFLFFLKKSYAPFMYRLLGLLHEKYFFVKFAHPTFRDHWSMIELGELHKKERKMFEKISISNEMLIIWKDFVFLFPFPKLEAPDMQGLTFCSCDDGNICVWEMLMLPLSLRSFGVEDDDESEFSSSFNVRYNIRSRRNHIFP